MHRTCIMPRHTQTYNTTTSLQLCLQLLFPATTITSAALSGSCHLPGTAGMPTIHLQAPGPTVAVNVQSTTPAHNMPKVSITWPAAATEHQWQQ
jgi:hypothetical protein